MTDITDKKLGLMLDSYQAPEPSDLLKARILKRAQLDGTADDAADGAMITPASYRDTHNAFWPKGLAALAACAVVMAGLGFMQISLNSDIGPVTASDINIAADTAIEDIATDLGFEDVYEWVESEAL